MQIIATMRPKFLLLTPSCLSLAIVFAITNSSDVNIWHMFLVLFGGVLAHISVNMFNEYRDFNSGLDFYTERTPFSGGSGTLVITPELAIVVYRTAIFCGFLAVLIACYFAFLMGWALLPLVILGSFLVYFYTDKITHNPWICLIAPGLGFGPVMICAAYFALSGGYSSAVFAVSMVPFFLVNNVLLLNQFPDLEPDRKVGRLHLPIVWGRERAASVYVGFLVAAYLVLLLAVVADNLPVYTLLGLLTVLFAVPVAQKVVLHANTIHQLQSVMALNVLICLTTPLLIAIGVMVSANGFSF